MNLDAIKEFLSGSETALPVVPDAGTVVDKILPIAKVLVVAGPVIMLILGLLYLFAAPREANHHFGYRCYFGMGSEQAWRFTQRIAGITWTALGAIMTVVMLIVTGRFSKLDVLEMLTSAVTSLVWEALVLLVATIIIRIIVAARYDRHGERRVRK